MKDSFLDIYAERALRVSANSLTINP